MKQAQMMQKKMQEMQQKMASTEFTGTAGGGMVNVIVSGKFELLKLKIDSSLIDPTETEMLEDLIVAAFNDAKKKIDAGSEGEMSGMIGGMGLPNGFKLPF